MSKPKRPRDTNQLAKSIVDLTTGDAEEDPRKKDSAVRSASGSKGGKARANTMTAEQRSEIARLAAAARWKKSKN